MQVESDSPAQIKEEDKPEESVVVSDGGKTAQILVEEPPIDLHNNDTKVLSVLNEAGSNYSFKGLMRKLEMHQQSLSRALHRLEELGLVEKSEGGYKLVKSIAKVEQRPMGREFVQLLQTYIPITMRAGELVRHLAGRWFKNLRWIGMIESETGYTLQWASDDGTFQVNLRLVADYVIIETNAIAEKEKVQAMVGSYAIYEQITRVVQSKIGAYSMNYRPQHN